MTYGVALLKILLHAVAVGLALAIGLTAFCSGAMIGGAMLLVLYGVLDALRARIFTQAGRDQ